MHSESVATQNLSFSNSEARENANLPTPSKPAASPTPPPPPRRPPPDLRRRTRVSDVLRHMRALPPRVRRVAEPLAPLQTWLAAPAGEGALAEAPAACTRPHLQELRGGPDAERYRGRGHQAASSGSRSGEAQRPFTRTSSGSPLLPLPAAWPYGPPERHLRPLPQLRCGSGVVTSRCCSRRTRLWSSPSGGPNA